MGQGHKNSHFIFWQFMCSLNYIATQINFLTIQPFWMMMTMMMMNR